MSIHVINGYHPYLRGISASGEGVLSAADCFRFSAEDFVENPTPVAFIMREGVTEVEEGVFDIFTTLSEIVIPDSVTRIGMTDATLAILKKNDVTVRGSFDSYADRFAKEYHLGFSHADLEIGKKGDYHEHGLYIVTLRFAPGGPQIHQDCRCEGISPGSMGGADNSIDLDADFYLTMTPDDIAALCWPSCGGIIRDSDKLYTFLKEAKARGGYSFHY